MLHLLPSYTVFKGKLIAKNTLNIVACACLLTALLSASGCKKMFSIQVQNNCNFAVVAVCWESDDLTKTTIGRMAAGESLQSKFGVLDGSSEYIIQIQDIRGNILGEVRQSQDQVHQHMSGHVWQVAVPQDLTSSNLPVISRR